MIIFDTETTGLVKPYASPLKDQPRIIELGIILPTNNPEEMFKFLLPSLQHIIHKNLSIEFLINFQPPWNKRQIKIVENDIRAYGFGFRYCFNTYKPPTPMCLARYHCTKLFPKADYYMFADDNFVFTNGTPQYPFSTIFICRLFQGG